ncbi:MAG: hypothetical protein ACHQF2_09460 [Flavobacteriales bacterium]
MKFRLVVTLLFVIFLAACGTETEQNIPISDSTTSTKQTTEGTGEVKNEDSTATSFDENQSKNENQQGAFDEESSCLTHRLPIRDSKLQEFKIKNNRDTTIRLKKGTEVFIPAGSLILKESNTPVVDAKINIREYLDVEDFILGDLATVAKGGKVLETGGSIYLEALSNTNKCEIKKGAYISIGFPVKTEKKLEDMQTFTGLPNTKNFISWNLQLGTILRHTDSIEVIKGKAGTRYQQFMDGKMSIEEYIAKNTHLSPNRTPKIPVDNIYVNFEVSTTGKPIDVKVTGAEDYLIMNKIENAVKFMPAWKPFMSRSGISSPDRPDREYKAVKMGIELRVQIDMVAGKILFPKDVKEIKGNTTEPDEEKHYVVRTSSLGFVNCDRFYEDKREKINMLVETELNNDAQAFFVFAENPAILRNEVADSKIYFKNIPVGVEGVLIYARKQGKDFYFSCQKITASKTPVVLVKAKKATEEEMGAVIHKYYKENS